MVEADLAAVEQGPEKVFHRGAAVRGTGQRWFGSFCGLRSAGKSSLIELGDDAFIRGSRRDQALDDAPRQFVLKGRALDEMQGAGRLAPDGPEVSHGRSRWQATEDVQRRGGHLGPDELDGSRRFRLAFEPMRDFGDLNQGIQKNRCRQRAKVGPANRLRRLDGVAVAAS